jgi:alkylation response protein AidB-like acyl-CoA dehydrogenase
MDFNLTEEQLMMIQQAARDSNRIVVRSNWKRWVEISTEQVKKMAELGFMGMMVDPKYGGSGLDAFLMF